MKDLTEKKGKRKKGAGDEDDTEGAFGVRKRLKSNKKTNNKTKRK